MSLSRLSLNSSFLYDYTLMVLQNGPYDDKIKKMCQSLDNCSS